MTVLSELSKVAYIGNSSQVLYPIPFEYINVDNIYVSVYTDNNEFVENWTYSNQYIIENNNVKVLSGFEIDNTKKLLIIRVVDAVQDNRYREGGDFPAKSTETSFDKLTMLIQQHQEVLDRCVKVEVLDNQTPEELLAEVYSKLDSATDVANDAIAAAEQATVAAENATTAVEVANKTLINTQEYVASAKEEINQTKTSAKEEIATTVSVAKQDINKTIDDAEMSLSDTITQATEDVKQAALDVANEAINDAAATATGIVVDYANNEIKPLLNEIASNAAESAENASESAGLAASESGNAAISATDSQHYAEDSRIWAEGSDSEVKNVDGEHSSKVWSEMAQTSATSASSSADLAKQYGNDKINQTHITNCITEIPQDIKLELNDGVLTLKAGSKVYVPNGAGKFDTYTVTSDIVRDSSYSPSDGKKAIILNPGKTLDLPQLGNVYSGAEQPSVTSVYWYDTTNNQVKAIVSETNINSGCSLLLGVATCSGGKITSIDQVFNGFGYIGSTVFALPNVKGLIPNGRNEDGSLKNMEFIIKNVSTLETSGTYTDYLLEIDNNNKLFDIVRYRLYDEQLNYNISSQGGLVGLTPVGKISTSNGIITSFQPKLPFRAADMNDVESKADKSQFQVVSALPSSPTSGVFYFIKE